MSDRHEQPAVADGCPTRGAAPTGEPIVYSARTVFAVACDRCGAGHAVTIVDPDPVGAGWAVAPERCRNGCEAGWRVMAVPGDGSATNLSASWEQALEATFPAHANPFHDHAENLPAEGGRIVGPEAAGDA